MCGFAGVVRLTRAGEPAALRQTAEAMAATLRHRGPDGSGSWTDPDGRAALAHRRLAVLDLTPAAAQPMTSPDGRHVLVFNGEIYNHREIRAELAGHAFAGTGDTEVLLAALVRWGAERTLEQANGMFAWALWDRDRQVLTLARDRIGEKPLVYAQARGSVLFASEVRALAAHPDVGGDLDAAALAGYLTHGFVAGQQSILRDVRRVPAGSIIEIPAAATSQPAPRRYWDLRRVAASGLAAPLSEGEGLDRMRALLTDAAAIRLQADVPVGAFLSGGIDSTLVTALLQHATTAGVRTFTVAMDQASHDEAAHAAAIARHLGTDHTELQLDAVEGMAAVADAAAAYDEPFADPSAVPVMLIARTARRHITVALTGDGGDEVFGGYNRYVLGRQAWTRLRRLPLGARVPLGRALAMLSPQAWDRLVEGAARVTGRQPPRNPGDKLHKLAALAAATTEEEVYRSLAGVWDPPPLREPVRNGTAPALPGDVDGLVERMMLADSLVTLPDCMLVKVDRATMATSLEARVPLLDHRVVELAWRLPASLKIAGGTSKVVLRRLLEPLVPAALLERPKMGFDPPIAAWLRGSLRTWGEELLSANGLASGMLDLATVRDAWREHQSRRRNRDYELWTVLMFLAWSDTR